MPLSRTGLVLGFLIKRFFLAIFCVIAVTLIIAAAIRMTGDPALMQTQGAGSFTEADLVKIREGLGLNQPFYVQYLGFLKGLVTLDFGRSFQGGLPVNMLIAKALPATLLLAAVSMVISIAISIPLGIMAAVHRGKSLDQLIRVLTLVGISFPNFWLGIMLMLVFGIWLKWLPPSGYDGPASLIMPALTMGVVLTASNVRLVRTSMLDTMRQQYVTVARAKGLSETKVLYKHALRNSAIPLVTYFGLQFGALLGGLVVIERVFNWPGMGTLVFDAVAVRDYPVLQAVIAILAISIIAINLAVDILYGIVDPRIRKGG